MMSVFGHDQLQSILMFLQRRPQLLVLLLQGSDVSVLLLDAQHQLRPGSVVRHLVQVLNVLLVIRFDQNYFTDIYKIISVTWYCLIASTCFNTSCALITMMIL